MGEVLVGTAAWTDKTLLESGWYPPDVRTPAERLRYYANHFPLVEVDSTYYAPPAERTARLWAERAPEGFTFDVKAFSLLTCHPTRPAALPKDLREAAAPAGKNLYLKDVDPPVLEQLWERFVTALLPLWEAGKFGAVLFQFPRWFPISKRNKQYILECKRHCEPLRIAVEFRNRTWMTRENQEETLDFLRSYAMRSRTYASTCRRAIRARSPRSWRPLPIWRRCVSMAAATSGAAATNTSDWGTSTPLPS